jgi:hypothetical protein
MHVCYIISYLTKLFVLLKLMAWKTEKVKFPLCKSWRRMGSGGIVPFILNTGCKWRWVVSFTPPPVYFLGNSPPPPAPIEEAGWAQESVLTLSRREKSRSPAGDLLIVWSGKLIANYDLAGTVDFLDSAALNWSFMRMSWADFPGGTSESSAWVSVCRTATSHFM